MNQPQNIKTSTNFIEVNGIGVVHMKDGSYRDVFVYGYFIFDRWAFIVHRDTEDDRYLTVSEASTGALLQHENYYEVEDALYYALPFCEKKHHYFAIRCNDILAKTQQNLKKSNTTNLRTLAIDTALWL